MTVPLEPQRPPALDGRVVDDPFAAHAVNERELDAGAHATARRRAGAPSVVRRGWAVPPDSRTMPYAALLAFMAPGGGPVVTLVGPRP